MVRPVAEVKVPPSKSWCLALPDSEILRNMMVIHLALRIQPLAMFNIGKSWSTILKWIIFRGYVTLAESASSKMYGHSGGTMPLVC